LFQRRVCICPDIPLVPTRTRVVIVRHHLEQHRSSNSGRLAHFALPNSEIVEHGGRSGPTVLPPMDGAYLVYPIGEPASAPPLPLPKQLVFLDASWSQARRMFRKIEGLRGLPILNLPHEVTKVVRMRAAPTVGHVSTLEAIARALRLLEGDAVARPLEELFGVAVARVIATGRILAGSEDSDA
jgi:DTW domain-containing protein YfiP